MREASAHLFIDQYDCLVTLGSITLLEHGLQALGQARGLSKNILSVYLAKAGLLPKTVEAVKKILGRQKTFAEVVYHELASEYEFGHRKMSCVRTSAPAAAILRPVCPLLTATTVDACLAAISDTCHAAIPVHRQVGFREGLKDALLKTPLDTWSDSFIALRSDMVGDGADNPLQFSKTQLIQVPLNEILNATAPGNRELLRAYWDRF